MTPPGLHFGIYPLSVAGTPTGLAVGPPDDYNQIRAALEDLGSEVTPRTYLIDMEPGGEDAVLALADRYRDAGLLGHVTLGCLRNSGFDLDRWTALVRTIIERYGESLQSVQLTNEPNLSFMDGGTPYVLEVLVHGILAAKDEARRRGLPVDVGFGSVPRSPAAVPTFWEDLGAATVVDFVESVDFVGHNFYVDVFEEPIELTSIPSHVEQTIRDLRFRDVVAAHIPLSVPIRITENGWPIGSNPFTHATRSPERQAEVIDAIVRTIDRLREELNISHYMLFGLRDADSSKADLFHQFGITRDDYSPKPAYHAFKSLIQEIGSEGADPSEEGRRRVARTRGWRLGGEAQPTGHATGGPRPSDVRGLAGDEVNRRR